MKTFILLFTYLILFSSSAYNQSITKIKKTCEVYSYAYEYGKPSEIGVLSSKIEYNEFGKPITLFNFNEKSKFINKISYLYNSDGLPEKEVLVTKAGKTVSITTYKYNIENLEEQIIEYDSRGKMDSKIVYTFSQNNKTWTERIEYDRRGLFEKTIVEKFDSQNRRISGKVYNSELKEKFLFKIEGHDKFDNELKKIFYKPDGTYYLSFIRKWDAQNNLILKIYEKRYKISYSYNENNDLEIEITYNIETDEPIKMKKYNYIY